MTAGEELGIGILASVLAFPLLYFGGRYLDRLLSRREGRGRSVRIILPREVNEFVALADDYRKATGFNALAAGFGFGVMVLSALILGVNYPNGGEVPVYLLVDVFGGSLIAFAAYWDLSRAHARYVAAVEQLARGVA
jgi:hypothetical protein